MQKQKRRKTWLLIWGSLLLLTIARGGYNWMQARQIVSEMVEVGQQQARSINRQASVPALEIQQGMQLRLLELHKRRLVNSRNRIFIVLLFIVFGVLTIVAYRRLKKVEKEIDPQSLIDEIGNKP